MVVSSWFFYFNFRLVFSFVSILRVVLKFLHTDILFIFFLAVSNIRLNFSDRFQSFSFIWKYQLINEYNATLVFTWNFVAEIEVNILSHQSV